MKFPVIVISHRHARTETDRYNEVIFTIQAGFAVQTIHDYNSLISHIAALDGQAYEQNTDYIRREESDYYYNHVIKEMDENIAFAEITDIYETNGLLYFPESWTVDEITNFQVSVNCVRLIMTEDTYTKWADEQRRQAEKMRQLEAQRLEDEANRKIAYERSEYLRLKAKFENTSCTPLPESSDTTTAG